METPATIRLGRLPIRYYLLRLIRYHILLLRLFAATTALLTFSTVIYLAIYYFANQSVLAIGLIAALWLLLSYHEN